MTMKKGQTVRGNVSSIEDVSSQ